MAFSGLGTTWHTACRHGIGPVFAIGKIAGQQYFRDVLRQAAELADLAFDAATPLVTLPAR